MCTLEFCFSGDCLYFRDFGKLHQVALSLYILLSIIFPPLLHSLFLYVFFEALLSQLSHTCSFFMHGRALCQLLSCVKRSSEGFRYIFTAKWWKKKPFSEIGKQWCIYFSPKVVSFQNPLHNTCNLPFTFDTRCPRKGPKKCTWHLIHEQETVTEKEIRVYSHASCSVCIFRRHNGVLSFSEVSMLICSQWQCVMPSRPKLYHDRNV